MKDVFDARSRRSTRAIALSSRHGRGEPWRSTARRDRQGAGAARPGSRNAPAAAALVTGIPTTYRYDVTASLTGGNNGSGTSRAASTATPSATASRGTPATFSSRTRFRSSRRRIRALPAHYKIEHQRQRHREVAGRRHVRHSRTTACRSDDRRSRSSTVSTLV